MHIFLGIIGIALALAILKEREKIGDMIGEAEWMRKVGGVYNILIFVAIVLFLWSIAEMTGTTNVLFAPLKFIIPGGRQTPPEAF